MKIFFYGFILILISCNNEIVFEHEFIENHRNKVFTTYQKTDTVSFNKNGSLKYNSRIVNIEGGYRQWVFPNPIDSIGKKLETAVGKQYYVSKIIDKRLIYFEGKTYPIVKYLVDQVAASDEESNKFYTADFGVILETYWIKNSLFVTKINQKTDRALDFLISEIKKDENFMFDQHGPKDKIDTIIRNHILEKLRKDSLLKSSN